MPIVQVKGAGSVGVNKDLSQHELPLNAWTDANNIRFLDGMAMQVLGHKDLYPTPAVTPYHVMPLDVAGVKTWIYCGAQKIYTVVNGPTHTNITRQTTGSDVNYTATRNGWTSCLLGGIPILNNGIDAPQQWLLSGRCTALSNWPANTTAKSVRAYKNGLIALWITKSGVEYPYMVKFSHPADPGAVPPTWDPADATKDAGEFDLSEGYDKIIDGLTLRDSFMVYKERSIYRLDFTGGPYVLSSTKVLGTSGAMAKNCVVELDGVHFVLTGSDCIVHDGNTANSVLDKATRRHLFTQINSDYSDRCFVFLNRLYNEVFVCYPELGSTVCNRAMVWNYVDKTISFRDIPDLNHATNGYVDDTSGGTWASASGTWDEQTRAWDAAQSSLSRDLSVMASDTGKLYLLDSGTTFDGVAVTSHIEKQGSSFDAAEAVKLIRGIRPRINGGTGTVTVKVGSAADPYTTPNYTAQSDFTIGSTLACDLFHTGRYMAIRFESGTATNWRLDSYDIDIAQRGKW